MKYLVALDLSLAAHKSFETALQLANASDQLILLSVVDTPSMYIKAKEKFSCLLSGDNEEEIHAKALALYGVALRHNMLKCSEVSQAQGIATSIELFYNVSHVGKAICQYCSENAVDCLIMGTRGMSVIEEFFLGSTSKYCLENAPCAVNIVKLSSGEQEKADNYLGMILDKVFSDETELLLEKELKTRAERELIM